jgi:hypothetical protein
MEHSQNEFIIEQLKSIDRMFEVPKSTELLHLEKVYEINIDTLTEYKEPLTHKDIVVKSYPQNLYGQSLREYLIGLKVINPLRKIIPCFVNTLGALKHKTKTFIMYEKVDGDTLAVMLQEGLSFNTWLCLFVQILLSLEVAQRKTGFTHYDLHAGNVVVCKSKSTNYSLSLGTLSYQVTNPIMTPVIIDLGTSSTSIDGRFIGSYDYMNSGIFHFIVTGHDMYKLMVSSYCYAQNSDTKKQILRLFNFFSPVDPYKVCRQGNVGITKAQQEFCKEVLFSEIASYTPLMMINYIYGKFHKILAPTIDIVPRRTLSSLLPLKGTEDYNQVLEASERLVNNNSGYVTALYTLYVAQHSTCPNIQKNVKIIGQKLENDRQKRVVIDLLMLSEVFNINYPSQEELDNARHELLNTPIRYRNASVKEQRFDSLEVLLEYQDKLQPFLNMYFTILELNLKDIYKEWIERLCKSNLYMFYTKNKMKNDRARRWGKTLLATIISSC